MAGKKEPHGAVGVPVYANHSSAGDFSQAPGRPGMDAEVRIPNFNGDFPGAAPTWPLSRLVSRPCRSEQTPTSAAVAKNLA